MSNKTSLIRVLANGDGWTRLSALIMGIGHIKRHQVAKGIGILFLQLTFIYFMLTTGINNLRALPALGESEQVKVWNEAKQIYEYQAGDNSLIILLMGVVTLFIIVAIIGLWIAQLKHAYRLQLRQQAGKPINNLREDINSLFNEKLHVTLMSLPMLGILAFNVVPLIFMISMAFTTYSKEGNQLILFDWNGLTNFFRVLNLKGNIGKQFWGVLQWTIIWAFFATFINYFLGMMLAMVINRKDTKVKGLWRFCFVLSIAVPQFVSLLIMRTMLQPQGAINVLLQNAGLINGPLPFLTNAMWARITIIVINIWIGIPYTMLQVTGILKNIPEELYEAARMDGAGPVKIFFKITLPYMLFVTTPYLITTFVGNINNFNVIYLLSGGGPTYVGDTAGQTDLLVTWLYKLTVDQQYYNLGAVIGILTFVILTVITLVTYRNSKSYKNEEAFM
ncbi:sugar ABC transporter permease [Tuanshanicoccus lijuaniae]|uniref:carbohydrate ABC transporter permease n=1 Tax=Aerococcaceae bacterium zg-1292 TaxID=2774330 RepID=UPI001937CB67|nr:sugar ABC transporter permease [Aerococcaceae bacterium zg-A91]MBS4458405.1 sugar ABC transporter permease [Aerococcaceae bacterium zg-BR33]QQA36433.1 sugar ABC transporter permease [Aerococcaceae bacterium zg-1292]